jgi:hypothetical protein
MIGSLKEELALLISIGALLISSLSLLISYKKYKFDTRKSPSVRVHIRGTRAILDSAFGALESIDEPLYQAYLYVEEEKLTLVSCVFIFDGGYILPGKFISDENHPILERGEGAVAEPIFVRDFNLKTKESTTMRAVFHDIAGGLHASRDFPLHE